MIFEAKRQAEQPAPLAHSTTTAMAGKTRTRGSAKVLRNPDLFQYQLIHRIVMNDISQLHQRNYFAVLNWFVYCNASGVIAQSCDEPV